MRVEDSHHQASQSEQHHGDELDAEQINGEGEKFGVGRKARGERVANDLGGEQSREYGEQAEGQGDEAGEGGGQFPRRVPVPFYEEACKGRDEGRAERAACHEQEERLGDAVAVEEGAEFGRGAEGARDEDAARQSRELSEEDGEHHRPRRAGDLFVGG